uniref:ATP synthase complex subunit 8 n=1 Tax=Euphausia superba TaxID=6819 RepID=Q76L77_EUPSU|nr:ATP synthase F0 subunit 8 [Euphausia superba]ACH78207.1 ATP synthase subunit 8 [Euphausia superba]AEX54929.1 ATP synthase subunit 8 [Euphausia superba]AEX54942.1 ATP synthase subunit 8 [Euphausia superba]AEX54953.1 ATP synthase subunit 8 [Euphausia superba]AEX54966.1 ATP synthase subunit 8 [Euphausia superba]
MPQMSPLLWLNLFIMFSTTFMVFMTVNYFMKVPSKLTSTQSKLTYTKMFWKW